MMPFRRGNLLVFVVPENLDADFGGGRDVAFGAQGLEFFGESPGKFHDTRKAQVKPVVADIEDAPGMNGGKINALVYESIENYVFMTHLDKDFRRLAIVGFVHCIIDGRQHIAVEQCRIVVVYGEVFLGPGQGHIDSTALLVGDHAKSLEGDIDIVKLTAFGLVDGRNDDFRIAAGNESLQLRLAEIRLEIRQIKMLSFRFEAGNAVQCHLKILTVRILFSKRSLRFFPFGLLDVDASRFTHKGKEEMQFGQIGQAESFLRLYKTCLAAMTVQQCG